MDEMGSARFGASEKSAHPLVNPIARRLRGKGKVKTTRVSFADQLIRHGQSGLRFAQAHGSLDHINPRLPDHFERGGLEIVRWKIKELRKREPRPDLRGLHSDPLQRRKRVGACRFHLGRDIGARGRKEGLVGADPVRHGDQSSGMPKHGKIVQFKVRERAGRAEDRSERIR